MQYAGSPMDVTLDTIENEYARLASARRAFFVPGCDAISVFATSEIVRGQDVLVRYGDGNPAAALSEGSCKNIAVIDEPTAAAFLSASERCSRAGRLFWILDSLGGLRLRVPDLCALAEAAKSAHAMLVVDNSLATSFGCTPLFLGAHIALERIDLPESSEPVVAVGIARPERKRHVFDEMAAEAQGLFDGCASAPLSPKVLEGLADALQVLPNVAQARFDHARAIAEYAAANEMIAGVIYPGLKSHPDRDVAARTLMHGAGPALELELPNAIDAPVFLSNLDTRSVSVGSPCSARTRIYLPEQNEAHRLRIIAGTDDPLAVIDALDCALRALS